MQAFFSWLTSQSGVSLVVALIALGGVVWNNWAAEKRRHKDQEAADERRRKDQEAADERRRRDHAVEDRRREDDLAQQKREQLRLLVVEDAARQRKFILDYLRKIRDLTLEYSLTSDKTVQALSKEGSKDEKRVLEEIIGLALKRKDYFLRATALTKELIVEITDPNVVEAVLKILDELASLMKRMEVDLMDHMEAGGFDFVSSENSIETIYKSGFLYPPNLTTLDKMLFAVRDYLQPVSKFIQENE